MKRALYLHGFASSPSSTKARYLRERLLADGIEVEAPDLAAGDFERLTITGQLQAVERSAGEAVALIGSSMGGYVTALYAARHPEIERIVLLAPAFDFARLYASRLGDAALERWRTAGAMEVFHYGDNRNRSLGYGLLEDAQRYEPWPEFRQQALIFHGAHDDHVPASYSERYAAGHPNVRLELVDSGHDLHNVLEEIATKTVVFLRDRG
jgi:pimeloyl-ACP methyl ester carboxylesterase